MTAEREKAINEWLGIHCPKCANNDDRGTDFLNCQAECEVQKDIGIACIHYEEAYDIEPQKKRCENCNHYGKLSLDCGRCDDDCSMYEPQERSK